MKKDKISKKTAPFFILLMLLSLSFPVLSVSQNEKTKKENKTGGNQERAAVAFPVSADKVAKADIPVQLSAIGTVEASSTVVVKSQVGGILTDVHFKEGEEVNKGDKLFTIDKRPYEALLHKELANQQKNIVEEKNAREDYLRLESLSKKDIVSKETVDNSRTSAETKKMQLDIDAASVEYAKLQLDYCTIYSPIKGITGSLMVNAGNIVKANDTSLVTINQIHPIYVSFSIPEQDLAIVKQYFNPKDKLKVTAAIPGSESIQETGFLTFIDNQINRDTGTIKLRATFDNKSGILSPGQYVKTTLNLTTEMGLLVVPSEAVQSGQNGQFVYVIKSDNTVENRQITVGRAYDGKLVIEKGLSEGELVVTSGQLRISPGSKVEIKNTENK